MIRYALMLFAFIIVTSSSSLFAQGKAALAREAAEFVMKKFTTEAGGETLETLTRKIEPIAVKYGDEGLDAIKKVGPRSLKLIEESGEYGLESVRLMAKYGNDSVWVIGKKGRLAIFIKHGNNAANAMIKHGEIAEPLIAKFGDSAAAALTKVSPQNARRISMLNQDGDLASIGRTTELFNLVASHGDSAMNFIWKNKGSLAVATALTAFLANPDPFIDGTSDITKEVGTSIVGPVAKSIGENTNWTLVILAAIGVFAAFVGLRYSMHRNPRRTKVL